MARSAPRPEATTTRRLDTLLKRCPVCDGTLRVLCRKRRTVATLTGSVRLDLPVRRCLNPACERYKRHYRAEEEGAIVLPKHETGLDVIALVGALRYADHKSVPEIHRTLVGRDVPVCERTVTHLLDRYDELVALASQDREALRQRLAPQGRLIVALDGLQPDVGHEVLWVVRDVLSGEILLARSLLSGPRTAQSCSAELGPLLSEALDGLDLPVAGVVSDGQASIRKAVAEACRTWCTNSATSRRRHRRQPPLRRRPALQCRPSREDGLEEARPRGAPDRARRRGAPCHRRDRRGICGGRRGDARLLRGRPKCAHPPRGGGADDGRPPLEASGLKLHGRLTDIATSLGTVAEQRMSDPQKGGSRAS